jgi:hypothetical protein
VAAKQLAPSHAAAAAAVAAAAARSLQTSQAGT